MSKCLKFAQGLEFKANFHSEGASVDMNPTPRQFQIWQLWSVAIVKGNVQGKSLTVAESRDNRVTCACRNNIRKKNSSKLRYDLVGDEECQATVCRQYACNKKTNGGLLGRPLSRSQCPSVRLK